MGKIYNPRLSQIYLSGSYMYALLALIVQLTLNSNLQQV